jgi:maleylpyruvate isomerase
MPARVDQASDPAVIADLASVRLGTAFFRRALNRVDDEGLDAPSLLPGWACRHLVAHVGYNARAIARLVDWAATGVETPMYASAQARSEEIEFGATLPPEALRNLVEHSAIDLDVRWRDLPAERWDERVRTAQGRTLPAAETIWMRSREVWLHAVDLASGARLDQIPAEVLTRLLSNVHQTWTARGDQPAVTLRATDADAHWDAPDPSAAVVSGPLASLVGWATGRQPESDAWPGLSWSAGGPFVAPRWI